MYQHTMMTGLSGWPLILLPLLPGCCVPTVWESCVSVHRGNKKFLCKTSSQSRKFYLNFVFLKASCIGLHIILLLFLAIITWNLDRWCIPKEARYKPSWFSFPSSTALGPMWNWLQRLETLTSRWYKFNLALARLSLISHQRQPRLQCCKSLMSWIKHPEFSENIWKFRKLPPPFITSSSSSPSAPISLFSQGGPGNLRDPKPKTAVPPGCLTALWRLQSLKGRQSLNVQKREETQPKKEAKPETLFDYKIHQNKYFLACFLQVSPSRWKFRWWFFFSPQSVLICWIGFLKEVSWKI